MNQVDNYDEIYKLNEKDRAIVDRHLKLAGELNMWMEINSWLIDQIHDKKSKMGKGGYVPPNALTRKYYAKYLYRGQNGISSLDTFPSLYKSALEDIMYRELGKPTFDGTVIYYGHDNKPDDLKFDHFDKNEWSLSEGFEMNEADMAVMEKYKREFLEFLDKCVGILLPFAMEKRNKYKYTEAKKEYMRLVKVMVV